MATRLRSYKFPSQESGRPRIYPWDEWTDGSVWKARKDRDFTVSTRSFRSSIRNHAQRHGYNARTSVNGNGEVIFQFTKK